jgi:hypothetical protein
VNVPQPCPGPHPKQRLSSKCETRYQAGRQDDCTRISKQEHIGHRLSAIRSPVVKEIGDERNGGQCSKRCMNEKSPLHDRMEGTECDCEAGDKFEEENGSCAAGEDRRPAGRRKRAR